jgi:uncharacterized repeat protein (TIGR01451 family)
MLLFSAQSLLGDVSLTDKKSTLRVIGQALTPAQKQELRDANQAKRDAKKAKRGGHATRVSTDTLHPRVDATGSVSLIDAGGLKYFVNTNITFSTSSSASGAASEASYTVPVMASTTAGGVTSSTLSDMFDGYHANCVSLTNATGPCATGNASYTIYNQNGPASVDATVPAVPECTNRQYVFPAKTIGALSVRRKVYVPTNDRFIRWLDSYTNTSGAPVTFTTISSNNMGSDSNTRIVSSSSGDAVAQTTDTWVTTFQNFSGSTSSDPRVGHILQGAGAPTPVSNINFADGDDNPFWVYSITLSPGQTKVILNFATGLATKAAANTQSAALALLPATAQQCLSATELSQVTNFVTSADLAIVKTASVVTNVDAGQAYSYTLAVTNNGPGAAASVSVTDPLPAGVSFVSASGTGWTCGQALGTVTCTIPSLALGAANPITINVTAPAGAATLTNTATVASAVTDPTPGNNSSTNILTVVPVADLTITKTPSSGAVTGGNAFSYTINVSNAGPSTATSVTVTDVLPANVLFTGASGTGWTCGQAAGTVTCTLPSLPPGAANPITINVVAVLTANGVTNNTATVSSATADRTAGNNTSSPATVTLTAGATVPMLDPKSLAILAVILAAIAAVMIRARG